MSNNLRLDGVLLTSETKSNVKHKKHQSPRKSIGLNYSDNKRPFATALRYWKQHKLATPLIWLIFDGLAKQEGDVKAFVKQTTPQEFAEMLLKDLRAKKGL